MRSLYIRTGWRRLIAGGMTILAIASSAAANEPWVHSYEAVREFYVSPTGGGNGLAADSPISFTQARNTAQAGDVYWLLGGNYDIGDITLNRAGTASNPIVYRAVPGQRATLNGTVQMTGAHNWIWGLEFIDPRYVGLSIEARSAGVKLINNVIHNSGGGIGGWATGAGHVYYGNIIYGIGGDVDPQRNRTNYPTYTQSNYETHGYKYFVQNMFFDGRPYDNPFNFHGYTEGGHVNGFHLRENIFSNGRWIIGGQNLPDYRNVVEKNFFYDTPSVTFGWRRPQQFEFTDNYLGRSMLSVAWVWGDGETRYTDAKYHQLPTRITGNTIILPPGNTHIAFRTVAYMDFPNSTTRHEGTPLIRPQDVFDNNIYSGNFRATFHAGGVNQTVNGLPAWQNATQNAGNMFDQNATTIAVPTTPMVAVTPNEYEPGRGHVVVYNWGLDTHVTLDLASVLAIGDEFTLHAAKNIFGDPVLSGIYNGPVLLPMAGEEFNAYLLQSSTPIPEPGSILLIAAAAGMLLSRRRARA